MKLRLWSKPTIEDAETTASVLGAMFWLLLAFCVMIYNFDFVTLCVVCGCGDLIGRMMGIKSSYFIIPLWIIACIGCLLFLGVFDGLRSS
ncbi:MAG: hypothetical protein ACQ9ET_06135 [Nitrosomonadaceae bacterium]